MYANRKVRKLDNELKNELLSVASKPGKEPPSTTISGKIISVKEKYSKHLFLIFNITINFIRVRVITCKTIA